MSLQLLRPDSPHWESLFVSLPASRQDVFYSPGFARLCQATINRNDEVWCAAMSSDMGPVLYPFVRRSVGRLTGRPGFERVFDMVSLYGRGGLVVANGSESHLPAFHQALAEYCRDTSVMCAFDRYHPVIGNHEWGSPGTRVIEVGGFVVVDMRPAMDIIEAQFKPSVRKDLRKAERNGVACFAESSSDHLDHFLEIYRHTMERNVAGRFYYFSEEYFRGVARELSGQFHYFFARADDEIVSCELVLHCGKYCHSFLGGTRQDALSLCANPMLKREIIRYMKERGAEHFLLGGGTRPDDGIFNFKKAYAPEGVVPSRVGGTIWNPDAYERLQSELALDAAATATGRFQFYDPG